MYIMFSNDIGDEYHYMLICQHFKDIREIYVTKWYYKKPSVHALCELLKEKG